MADTTNRVLPIIALCIALAFAACAQSLFGAIEVAYAQNGSSLVSAQASGPNLNAAKAKFNVPDSRVYKASPVADVSSFLTRASSAASAGDPCIVYAPAGSYAIKGGTTVPANVILVGEAETVFSCAAKADVMIKLSGSIYGGTFDGKGQNKTIIRYAETTMSGNNGIIENASIINSSYYGIVAMHVGAQGGKVLGCTVTNCVASGISILDAARIDRIENCNVSDNGTAGINLSHADVGPIVGCTLNNNGDKAVSTNSDPVAGYTKPGCTLDAIENCTIIGNKTNGVHIKPLCTLGSFTGNYMQGNMDCLTAVAVTPAGTKGASVINNVSNNTFTGSNRAQLKAVGKGATMNIGSGNVITNGKASGIEAESSGVVKVNGDSNKIQKNKGAGLNAKSKSKITIKGKGNVISKNKKFAVYCTTKAKVTLKNVKVKGRVYTAKGGKVKGVKAKK